MNILSVSSNDSALKPQGEDEKCAPSRKFEFGSCIRYEILLEFVNAYNEEFPNNKIKTNKNIEITKPNSYKKYLIKELKNKLKCTTQKCWTQQKFIKRMPSLAKEELEKYTFRSEGPTIGNKWLNTDHINNSMTQYEKKYPHFCFLGAVPKDFKKHSPYKEQNTDDHYKKLWKSGKTCIGMIYNTDPVGKSGEHWNALYANFNNGEVYFFDSYGVSPNSHVQAHMRQLHNFITTNCSELSNHVTMDRNKNNLMKCHNIKTGSNTIRHQYEGSECGVYSMNFIIRMLKGKESFDDICKSKIDDKTVNKCRRVYFTKETK